VEQRLNFVTAMPEDAIAHSTRFCDKFMFFWMEIRAAKMFDSAHPYWFDEGDRLHVDYCVGSNMKP
jgi:hypothetical protein